jgi:hypothetical protein
MSFQQILDKHRSLAFSERDKGSRFERLMQAYLRTDPLIFRRSGCGTSFRTGRSWAAATRALI